MKKDDVISHLQIIYTWASFAHEKAMVFRLGMSEMRKIKEWTKDALELLKEQEAVVRCKDCKHNEGSEANVICAVDMYRSRGNAFYCADGERRSYRQERKD